MDDFFETIEPDAKSSIMKGFEKLDNANTLFDAKKYPGAITEYVSSYEELGYGLFLLDSISNDLIKTMDELKEYLKPGSHTQKILSAYIIRRDKLKKYSEDDFNKIKNSKIGKDFNVTMDSKTALTKVNQRIAIYSKLHRLRQFFDYSHTKEGQIITKNYSNEDLQSLCYLLKTECLNSHCEANLYLEGHPLQSQRLTDEEMVKKITLLSAYKKYLQLNEDLQSKNNQKLRQKGLNFIKEF